MRRIVIVAAMPFEVEAISRGLTARMGDEFQVVAAGPGFQAARKALASIKGKPDVLVSAGICGGLDPEIGLYEIVAGTSVNEIDCEVPASRRTFRRGKVASVDRVAASVGEKRRLAATGAVVVDMESIVIAEHARRIGVPMFCIKSVSDTSAEEFVLDFNAARDVEGRFRAAAIVGQALRRPWQGVPELFRLKKRGEEASRRLGEFFADCDI